MDKEAWEMAELLKMEEFYHSISKAINIDKDRQEYTRLYDFVRISVINGLKENEIFSELFNDLSLSGSYADNLKVTKPDEFDLVVRLQFPFHDDVLLHPDPYLGGNVYINLHKVIQSILRYRPYMSYMLKFINQITNKDGYLLQDKFQSWVEGILTKYLSKIGYKLNYGYDNKKVVLKYIKQGPAHTIKVRKDKIEISIDFVPGFRFTKSQSILPQMNDLIYEYDDWEAIPKPINGKSSNPSFQCSYTESERRLLIGRNQFKNALRMMKKFRDMNPALMFELLEIALAQREIPFFWDSRLNLLKLRASTHQIDCMYHEVRKARKILANRSNIGDLQKIKNLFLTKAEQQKMSPELKQEIERNFWQVAKEAAGSYLPWAIGILAVVLISSIWGTPK